MNENKKIKRRRFKIKIGYLLAFLAIIVAGIFVVKLILPGNGASKYGTRLEGIDKVPFETKAKDKVTKKIKENEKVSKVNINVHGKIINVIFNVKKDTSKDDARKIAEGSLESFSEKVRNFYDIEYIITKTDEEGVKEEKLTEDGEKVETIKKDFPIMGYKNSKSSKIVW